jgi:hypothetical protein
MLCYDDLEIQARFNFSDNTVLTQVATGLVVTVEGKVSGIQFKSMVLTDCVLLQIGQA